ncbi:MAG: hypothetical protein OEV49_14245 [candidate division Zixibacteria bacterium]|nr:hypothetical protein [candidate division Zixibacteria bacterium]MDH3937799.1 hypothetical protein [candidate division Zixibacteria bacterium]MDH4034610.1 hypothetical protein [candidate division Zixibacteria bacterium]
MTTLSERTNIIKQLKYALSIVAMLAVASCGKNHSNPVNRTFDSILDLYDEYRVVHLGERHWNMTDYDFRISLINYPRFAEVVDDIVIESGNYLYQHVLDEFIVELKDPPKSELQKVWRNTVVTTGVWDATIYKEFIYAVRAVNEGLSPDQRIRLIAAEPPIEWSKVHTVDEFQAYFCQRSTHTPAIIKTEVIDKGRKAFVVYGGAHFYKSGGTMAGCAKNIRANLEEMTGIQVFNIEPVSGDETYPWNFNDVIPSDSVPLFLNLTKTDASAYMTAPLSANIFGEQEVLYDGVLYLGPGPDLEADYDPEAANDSVYQTEFERRRAIESQRW